MQPPAAQRLLFIQDNVQDLDSVFFLSASVSQVRRFKTIVRDVPAKDHSSPLRE
jgi:hypothetical protein